jgi:hypothetical protein
MSIEKSFETSQTPHLIIGQIHGNMQLRAWDESRVSVSGNGNDYRLRQEGDQIVLGDFDDCRIFVPTAASVTLGDVHGNAQVTGMRGQLKIQHVHGNLRAQAIGSTQLGRVDGDCPLQDVAGPVVVGAVGGNFHATEVKGNVQLEKCGGNCTLREVEGEITLGRVGGNLTAHETLALTVDNVHGNATLKESNGSILIHKVAGNVVATESAGDLEIEWIGGELRVRELAGALNAKAGGTATLYLQELSTPQVAVKAGGDIRCRVPLTLDATLELRAGNEIVIKNLPLPSDWDSHSMEFTVGSGEGRLELDAGNRIKLIGTADDDSTPEWGFEDEFSVHYDLHDLNERAAEMVQQVAEQVEAQVEAVTRQLNERLSQLDSGDAIAAKVQQKMQAAMRRAEEKIAEAMRRAEQQAERQAERQAARDERRRVRVMTPFPSVPPIVSVGAVPPIPPQPAKPKRAPASSEERMMVLRMVEEGKISVEQAEKLLSAMGD